MKPIVKGDYHIGDKMGPSPILILVTMKSSPGETTSTIDFSVGAESDGRRYDEIRRLNDLYCA